MEPKGEEGGTSNLLNLEADTWNITDGVTLTTETGHEHLVVLVHETHGTILGHEACNSLVVLFQLHTHTLTDSRVGLLGFDGDLLDDDASGLGCAREGLLPARDSVGLGVLLVGPSVRKHKHMFKILSILRNRAVTGARSERAASLLTC